MFNARALLKELNDKDVEFVVIGGMAMISHGSSHVTRDLDICYDRSAENINRLVNAIAALHPTIRDAPKGLPFIWDDKTVQAGFNFTLDTDVGPIDMMAEVIGVGTFSEVKENSITLEIFGFEVRVLSLDALIAAKRAASRPKDLSHLLELEEIRKLREEDQADE